MADGTLSPNSRELEDGEVVDITELSPEGHCISHDVERVLDADHMSPSVVDNEGPPLEQVGAKTPQPPLLRNTGGAVLGHRLRTVWSHNHTAHPHGSPRETQVMAHPLQEKGGRQSITEADQHSEYLSLSHHSSCYMGRHMMSAVDLTHEMAEIKEHFTQSGDTRADAQRRERESKEETDGFHLWLNNLEIA
jgi:hypothetical protein